MPAIALLLLSCSVAIHTGWNLLSKRAAPTAGLFWWANLWGCVLLLPVFLAAGGPQLQLTAPLLAILLATGVAQAVYYVALAGAYRSGQFSVVYPLARSLPPLFVVTGSLLLGRGAHIGGACWSGIACLVLGCFLISRRGSAAERTAPATLALAFLTALATAGYSLLDDLGVATLRVDLAAAGQQGHAALSYLALEAWSTQLLLTVWCATRGPESFADIQRTWRRHRYLLPLLGAMIYGAYGLFLTSLVHVADVSYAVGFRQLAVPLGATIGVRFLGESMTPIQGLGVALCTAGLVLLAVF
jgi:drug/metabolite transporter (DMT)-like permease